MTRYAQVGKDSYGYALRLPRDAYNALVELANDMGLSVNALIICAVDDYLRKVDSNDKEISTHPAD